MGCISSAFEKCFLFLISTSELRTTKGVLRTPKHENANFLLMLLNFHFKYCLCSTLSILYQVPIEPELIVRENEPVDLPVDVVRSSQKMDYGLEELANLTDVRSKFLAFEQLKNEEEAVLIENVSVKRSPSILNRIAKFVFYLFHI